MNLRRLLIVYMSALCLLFLSVVGSMLITELAADEIVEDAAKMNLAGRQRMLSQRIIYLAQDLTLLQGAEAEQTRRELTQAIEELQSAVYLFESSHAELSLNGAIAQDSRDLYFEPNKNGINLNARVQAYLDHARGILANPNDIDSLNGLREIERAGLLRDLDAVVSNIEAHSNTRVAFLQNLERGSLILAVLIIVVEVAFVFLPGHRLLQRVMERLTTQNKDLQSAYEASEALRKEQAEFTYSVSHDLKSPANSIGMILDELILDEGDRLSDEGKELIDEASAIVARIGLQVQDILEYAEATSSGKQPERISIQRCIDAILKDLRHDILSTGAVVTVDADVEISGYQGQVITLLQNLLSNALKFRNPEQPPEIQVTATFLEGEDGVQITVQDNGIGINPDHHARIFKLFERLHTRDKFQGTGLGLATCKRIADNHKGSIKVTSTLDEGSCFTVILRPPSAPEITFEQGLAA